MHLEGVSCVHIIKICIYLMLQMNGHTQFPKEREEGHLDDEDVDEDEELQEGVEGGEDEEKEVVMRVDDSRHREPEKVCECFTSQKACHRIQIGFYTAVSKQL